MQTFTAFCHDENENMVTLKNIQAEDKGRAFMAVWKLNPNLRVLYMLTDEEIQYIKDVLNGKE